MKATKRIVCAIVAALLAAVLGVNTMAAETYASTDPAPESVNSKGISPISGTFIQPWLYNGYSEADWDAEFTNWQMMGIEYLIMGDVAFMSVDDLKLETDYPSHIADAAVGQDNLTKLYQKCAQYNIKLYIGIGNTNEGWPYLDFNVNTNAEKFKNICARFAEVAEDLYNIYYEEYKDVFAGFYFVPELYNSSAFDNETSRKKYVDGLSGGLNVIFEKINAVNSSLPLIFSPYVNLFGGSWVTKNYENMTAFWRDFLTTANFRDGDILCPQDSCGAGGCDTDHLDDMTKAYRQAVDTCGKKVLLYSNCEIFKQPSDELLYEPNFETWSSMTVRDMTDHFRIVAKYVDRIFAFAYPHYLSAVNTVPGYYNTYMNFLKTGEIESEAPTAPDTFRTNFSVVDGKRCFVCYWSGMYDNYGIHRVNIYKNGELFTFRIATRRDGGSKKALYPNNFFDLEYTEDTTETVTYEFEAIDCAGNVSERTTLVVEPGSVPNGVKLGTAYSGPTEESSEAESSAVEASSEAESAVNAASSADSSETSESNGTSPWLYIGLGAAAAIIAGVVFVILRRKK